MNIYLVTDFLYKKEKIWITINALSSLSVSRTGNNLKSKVPWNYIHMQLPSVHWYF